MAVIDVQDDEGSTRPLLPTQTSNDLLVERRIRRSYLRDSTPLAAGPGSQCFDHGFMCNSPLKVAKVGQRSPEGYISN